MADKRPEAESFSAAAQDAKDSVVNAAGYVKDRLTASPTGKSGAAETDKSNKQAAKDDAQSAKDHAGTAADKAGDSVKETFGAAGDKVGAQKDKAKDKYDETQQSIADQIATNPVEDSRARGEIPADTETVNKLSK